jgi:outer membrane receptor for ferrienterochelin and colicins
VSVLRKPSFFRPLPRIALHIIMLTGCATGVLAQDATPVSAASPTPLPATMPTPAPTPAPTTFEPRIENGRQIYDAAAFARFAPQTARDMVGQIPGFTITQVSGDRGLGEATQNVLINGQRISGKGDGAEAVLGRTPAKSVVQLEIADGATFNISGLNGQVLNVITKPDSFSGNFAWSPEFRRNLEPRWYNAELNVSGKIGKGDYTFGINNNDSFRNGFQGREVNRDALGALRFSRNQVATFYGDRPHIGASYSLKSDSGSIFNTKASYEQFRFRRNIASSNFAPGRANINELSTGSEDEWNMETTTDYEFAALGGRLKLVNYNRFEHSPFKNLFRQDTVDGTTPKGSRFDQVVDEGEIVLRSEFKWKSGKNDWQISLEGARNFLDSTAQLFELVPSGTFDSRPLPGANARVEEKRAQMILSYGRPLTKNLTLQTTFGGEYSQLTQTGGNEQIRSFIRPKGSASLAWKATPRLDINMRLQRKVGQLNFFDFLASVDLQDANNNADNSELVPPQSWIAEVEINRSLGAAGSIKFKVEAEKISDIVDQIPIGATQEAIGNLPSAKRIRGQINASFLLDTIGWKGAKLDIEASAQKTALRDSLKIIRPINDRGRYGYSIDFRHDIPHTQWAWGAFAEFGRDTGFYRLDYRYIGRTNVPFVLAFVEYKDVFGLKVKGQLMNIANQHDRSRELFYVNRRDGNIETIRDSDQRYGMFYRLSISGTF